jgi:hypothetical protein
MSTQPLGVASYAAACVCVCVCRGDYSDAHQAERAREAIQDMANFFAQYVK